MRQAPCSPGAQAAAQAPVSTSPQAQGPAATPHLSAGLFLSTGFRRPLHPAGPSAWPSWGLVLGPGRGQGDRLHWSGGCLGTGESAGKTWTLPVPPSCSRPLAAWPPVGTGPPAWLPVLCAPRGTPPPLWASATPEQGCVKGSPVAGWLSVRPQAATSTPCLTSTEGRRVPFAGEASGFSPQPAPALLTPGVTAELFPAARGSVGAFRVLGGACSSVLAGRRRAWGDASGDGLEGGPARGPSALGWQFRAGEAAREGLWVREPESGTGPSSPSSHDPGQEPLGLPGQPVPGACHSGGGQTPL